MTTRLFTDLGDKRLSRLLKAEAYFVDRLEAKALAKLAESSFTEWDDPRDAEYDRL